MRYRKSSLLAWSMSLIIAATFLCTLPAVSSAQDAPAGAQAAPKDELPDSLEEMLAVALANNPDVRAAESQVEQAKVELNRIRLEIAQRVVAARNALDAQRNEIDIAKLRLEQVRARFDHLREANKATPGAVSESEVRQGMFAAEESQRAILREEAKLSDLEAELRYLLGRFPKGMTRQASSPIAAQAANLLARLERPVQDRPQAFGGTNTMLKRIREPLAEPIQLDFFDSPLNEVLTYLEALADVQFVIQPVGLAVANIDPDEVITVSVSDLETVASALRVIQDLVPSLRFVARDYGILVTSELGVEPGATLVHP